MCSDVYEPPYDLFRDVSCTCGWDGVIYDTGVSQSTEIGDIMAEKYERTVWRFFCPKCKERVDKFSSLAKL